MIVRCSCEQNFEAADYFATCPNCGEPVFLPRVSDADAVRMYEDLMTSLEAFGMPRDHPELS